MKELIKEIIFEPMVWGIFAVISFFIGFAFYVMNDKPEEWIQKALDKKKSS